jgi:5-(carboxyamino)imidazole ribonucleotide synthase
MVAAAIESALASIASMPPLPPTRAPPSPPNARGLPAPAHLRAPGSRRLRCVTDSATGPAGQSGSPAPPVVGMVGGGQLARMTGQAAIGLGVGFRVLAGSAADSAARVTTGTQFGDYRSLDDLRRFAAGCDVLTFDHEHVPGGHLAALELAGVQVRPAAAALRFTQDKLAMRERLTGLGIECPRFAPVRAVAEVAEFAAGTWPVVLKAVSGGYDGKGVWVCGSAAEAQAVLGHGIALIAEEYVAFERELAVLAARSPHRQGAVYPVVETVQRDGICREVIAPAPGLAPGRAARAQELALRIAAELGVTGLLAVEMFETSRGLLVNELAMRPHNCGHWTIEGARTSQFEQHLRAVLDLPLGSPVLAAPVTVMANVLGGDDADVYARYLHVMAADPAVKVHMYGKAVRPGRKTGHVTVTGDARSDPAGLADRARRAASYLRWGKEDGD